MAGSSVTPALVGLSNDDAEELERLFCESPERCQSFIEQQLLPAWRRPAGSACDLSMMPKPCTSDTDFDGGMITSCQWQRQEDLEEWINKEVTVSGYTANAKGGAVVRDQQDRFVVYVPCITEWPAESCNKKVLVRGILLKEAEETDPRSAHVEGPVYWLRNVTWELE
jgi:hypothetical protein